VTAPIPRVFALVSLKGMSGSKDTSLTTVFSKLDALISLTTSYWFRDHFEETCIYYGRKKLLVVIDKDAHGFIVIMCLNVLVSSNLVKIK
jgi:hypothetical protein